MAGGVAEGAGPGAARTALLTALALVAFAANSILCRLALAEGTIDPASFSAIRIGSGAITLALLLALRTRSVAAVPRAGGWAAAVALVLYAVPFSYSYLDLDAGTGALLLFGSVQVTMLLVALRAGDRPPPLVWTGLAAALAGLVFLVSPGLSAPSPLGAALMVVAGAAWGGYTLLGRGADDALAATARSFVRAVPLVVVVLAVAARSLAPTPRGAVLAAISGAVTSGGGYAIWIAALQGLSRTRAASVQLSVPVLAALGGALILAEPPTLRLGISAAVILGGIGLTLIGRERTRGSRRGEAE